MRVDVVAAGSARPAIRVAADSERGVPARSPLAPAVPADDAPRPHGGTVKRALLAGLCLCSGVAPLAARWMPGDVARIAYGVFLAAGFLAFTRWAGKASSRRNYRDVSFAFFVFALVQVLNNAVPRVIGTAILKDVPVAGDPLASTVFGTVVIQLVECALAVVPIVALTKASGRDLGWIYARRRPSGGWFVVAVSALFVVYGLTLRNAHRLIPTNDTITLERSIALTPALLVLVISNGFQEELLFRGLFLRSYEALFGSRVANVLQAAIFALAHVGVTYTPFALLFLVGFVFPLGLLFGDLMRRTDGVVAPAVVHAAADIPIYLAFLSYVS